MMAAGARDENKDQNNMGDDSDEILFQSINK